MFMSKLFSRKLYFEGFKQLRISGIILMAIFVLVSLQGAVTRTSDYYFTEEYYAPTSLRDANPLLPLLVYVAVPFMMVSIFKFTTNRAGSDFYFSAPRLRSNIFCSFILAVISWISLIAIVSCLVAGLWGGYSGTEWGISILYMLEIIVAGLIAVSAFGIAVSVCGTGFSAVITGFLILILPQGVISSISGVVIDNVPTMSAYSVFPIFNHKNNMAMNIIVGEADYTIFGATSSATAGAYIYSLVLFLVYITIGCILFNKRHSEAAGKWAASSRLRAIIRTTLAVALGIGVPSYIFEMIYGENYEEYDLSTIVFSLLFSFIVYCAYEWISTKKAKKVLTAMPMFLIVIVGLTAIFAVMFGYRTAAINYTPNTKAIQSIGFQPYGLKEYQVIDVTLKDTETKEIISDSLKENAECIKSGIDKFESKYVYGDYVAWEVEIKSNGINHHRNVYVAAENSDILVKKLAVSEEYSRQYEELPQPGDKKWKVELDWMDLSSSADQLYSIFMEEVKEDGVGLESFIKDDFTTDNSYFTFEIKTRSDLDDTEMWIPVGPEFKKTKKAFFKLLSNGNAEKATEAIDSKKSTYDSDALFLMKGDAAYYTIGSETLKILKEAETENLENCEDVAVLDYTVKDKNGVVIDKRAYFGLNEQQLKALSKYEEW